MAIPLVESPNVTRTDGRAIDTIVIHTMEIAERVDAADRCARWFANPASQVSAHYCVDAGITIQCVEERDIAWHARGGNATSIGIELAGTAAQTRADWDDPYSAAVLERAADLVADVAERHDVPIRRLRAIELRAGARGLTGHADVSEAWRRSDHWDPGQAFPWASFLGRIRAVSGVAPR